MINLAVIGAGYWGRKLIGEYLALSKKRQDVKLAAIVDLSQEILTQTGKTFSLPNSMLLRDCSKVFEDPEITGVHIATPNETHYEIAREAIRKGKHVLLEKPMCLSSRDAFRLVGYAEKNNSILSIGHIFRFNNAINKTRELVKKKEINQIRYIELRWTSFMPPPPGRDIIFDLAPHPIDILTYVLEEWPTRAYVNSHSYVRKKVGLEEVAFSTLDFPEDIIVSVILSWIHHEPRQRIMTIVSSNNAIEVEAVEQRIRQCQGGLRISEIPIGISEIPIERNNTIESEIDHFVECIKNGDPPINDALTGAMNVAVLEAMRKSSHENRVVAIAGGAQALAKKRLRKGV